MAAQDASAGAGAAREQSRLIEAKAGRIEETGKIGGEFAVQQEPQFLDERVAIFERLYERQQEQIRGEVEG